MDPVTAIVAALVLGAAAGTKDVAAQVVKDAYAGLKSLIARHYPTVDVAALEKAPTSPSRRGVVEEDLRATGAATDPELARSARELVELIQQHAPDAIGVDLEDVAAVNLRLSEIEATGTGVKVERGTFSGDIDIHGVRAGKPG